MGATRIKCHGVKNVDEAIAAAESLTKFQRSTKTQAKTFNQLKEILVKAWVT